MLPNLAGNRSSEETLQCGCYKDHLAFNILDQMSTLKAAAAELIPESFPHKTRIWLIQSESAYCLLKKLVTRDGANTNCVPI